MPFTLRSDDPVALRALLYRWHWLERWPRRSELVLDALFRPRQPRLVVCGRSRATPPDATGLLVELELTLYAELVARTPWTPLHAALVARPGGEGGVLLAGDSGAGKSSLAWALIQRGWTYLGEEHAFLREGARAQGFPRALTLERTLAGERVDVVWSPDAAREVEVEQVLLLSAQRDAEAPEPVGPAAAAAALARQLQRTPRGDDLARLTALCAQAPAHRLALAGLERSVAAVAALCVRS